MKIRVEQLTETNFAAFGTVLGASDMKRPNLTDAISNVWLGMSDLMGIGASPGRHITFLQIHSKPAKNNKIEKHETSAEAFIPMEGTSILMVVPAEATHSKGHPDMSKCRAFLMDGSKGVLIKPGTWHAVPYPLSDEATYVVLVDDAIIAKNDLHVTPVEEVEFDLLGIKDFVETDI
jgi:ureidoglycolate hydrolase